MIDQLKQIDRIYDLMALCGAYILCELKKKHMSLLCLKMMIMIVCMMQ